MKLKKIKTKYKKNVQAIFECEFCKRQSLINVYDDGFFFEHVIPELNCRYCDKKSSTKYFFKQNKDFNEVYL